MATFTTRKTVELPAVETPAADNDTPRHGPDHQVIVGETGVTSAGWHAAEAGIWCEKEGQLKFIRGVRLPQMQVPDHFVVGKMLHAGRAAWFARRFDTAESTFGHCKDEALKGAEENKMPVSEEAKRAAFKYLDEYITHWSSRPNPRPVAVEYLLGPAPLEAGDPFPLHRTARLDDVGYYPEAMGALAIGELKTTSDSIEACAEQYTLHGQPLLQNRLWKMAAQGEAMHGPVKGMVLDIFKKGYGKERSKMDRRFVEITPVAMEWYVREMRRYLRRFAAYDWNSDAPRNISACTRLVGKGRSPCEYRDLCLHGKSAAGNYVDREGNALNLWQPSEGKETPPWK
jgi:hypothetical protein